ncbi:MAG: antibiotic biosynthesis monooxygenase [Cytophagaceae bacterium]|nr:antibiotic biosynthesis monooxygenase [Cytophagaceae bacterium]
MSKYLLHGKLTAKQGSGEQLSAILLQAAQLISAVKGCQVYLISKDTQDKETTWVTEVWDSKEDHDNSLKLENVRVLIGQAMPILDGMPQKGQELEVLGGLGIK